jgi:homoserine dehydrogenase
MGCAIKLLGVAQKNDDHSLSAFVWPTFVKQSDTLAAVSGASNIVQVTSSNLGSASYVGPGAGRYPTANSVVADMVNIALGALVSSVPSHCIVEGIV